MRNEFKFSEFPINLFENYFGLGSQSAVIELLHQQLNEKEAELEQLRQFKISNKRPIRPKFGDVSFQCNTLFD